MDWDYAVERNREALKRVLLALAAMAGLEALGSSFSPFTGLRGRFAPQAQSCRAGGTTAGREGRDAAGGSGDPAGRCPEGADEGQHARPTLPRHLHRAVLRLLRPAESAARRLVIMAARGVVVPLPRPRKSKPKQPTFRPGTVTGIWTPPHLRPEAARPPRPVRAFALPLFDPLPPMQGGRRKTASGIPRICTPGWSAPAPLPPQQPKGRRPPAPDDAIDARRLALRLQALGRALDDLPREAKRFARWRAARDAQGAQSENRDAARAERSIGASERQASRRARRVWPLKPGRPPGSPRRPAHPVHEILRDTHALAVRVLEKPDTS